MLSQLLVQILAQAVRRPAGQGSHTGEICVAISDTHIITRAARLLTVWRGRGPSVKSLTTGGFRLDALNLLIPGKFEAMLSAFSFIGGSQLQAELWPCQQSKFHPHRITSSGDCFLHVVAIILLSDPSLLAAPTKTTAFVVWVRKEVGWGGAFLPTVHLESSASLCQQTTYRMRNSEGNLSLHGPL